jgi:hypothetical protein
MIADHALAVVVRLRASADYILLSSRVVEVGNTNSFVRPNSLLLLSVRTEVCQGTSLEILLFEKLC